MAVKRLLFIMIPVAKFFIAQCEAEVEACSQEESEHRRRVIVSQ